MRRCLSAFGEIIFGNPGSRSMFRGGDFRSRPRMKGGVGGDRGRGLLSIGGDGVSGHPVNEEFTNT
jgi:hypothetical protein